MENIIVPAICCIGYNRPESMRRLLNSVGKGVYDDVNIPLIISIDESDKSDNVEAVAREFEWKYGKKIIKRYPQRLGLKEHCMRCGDSSVEYGALIFLEDDVVVGDLRGVDFCACSEFLCFALEFLLFVNERVVLLFQDAGKFLKLCVAFFKRLT